MTSPERSAVDVVVAGLGLGALLDIRFEEDESYSVSIRAMPGHVGAGMTLPEAFVEANDAAEAWVAALRERSDSADRLAALEAVADAARWIVGAGTYPLGSPFRDLSEALAALDQREGTE